MAILAQGTEFEKPATGPHNAVCCYVYDIGTQIGHYEGHEIRNHQIVIGWELSQKKAEGEFAGIPFIHNEFYKLSLDSRSNLSKLLQAWMAKELTKEQRKAGIDIEKFVGIGATLNLVPKANNDRMTLSSIMPAIPGATPQLTQNAIPDWLKRKAAESVEQSGGGFDVPNPNPQQGFQNPHPQFPAPAGNQVPFPGPNGPVIPNQQNQVVQPPPPLIEDDLPF